MIELSNSDRLWTEAELLDRLRGVDFERTPVFEMTKDRIVMLAYMLDRDVDFICGALGADRSGKIRESIGAKHDRI